MNLLALSLYAAVNGAMILYYLRSRTSIYHFPFWAGVIAMGWFFPQAIGGYVNIREFPDYAFADGLYFASICSLALWIGYVRGAAREVQKATWLDTRFNLKKLYWACAALCIFGFYFQWKLFALPDELKAVSQWSGVTVKYLFLSNVFKFGFIALWLLYLNQSKLWSPRLLVLLIPGIFLLFKAAVIDGRREGMMNLVSYLLVGLWFAKKIAIPRWMLIFGLVLGLVLINSIGTYRIIMMYGDGNFTERLADAAKADYTSTSEETLKTSGAEFKNFIFYRYAYQQIGSYDYGLIHWNKLVFNYVPSQIVGREFKDSIMFPLLNINEFAKQEFGFIYKHGSTSTGYKDAFGSFGWFGFIKFLLIGWIMGALYRHGVRTSLLAQLLYIYMLGSAMLAITHTTHRILFSGWLYFLAMGFPAFYWAREKSMPFSGRAPSPVILYEHEERCS